jgi:hypothetical protein
VKNLRERHYNRVVMPREAKDYKKAVAWCGLAFVILFAFMIIMALSAHALTTPARLPDPKLTPGVAANVSAEQLCKKSFHTADVRTVTTAQKNEVYRRYGLKANTGYCAKRPYKTKPRGKTPGRTIMQGCEVDHLISLELGGANDVNNLWPQPYPENPGAHEKDKLENWLHRPVCAGKISLSDAQHRIATNWYAEYQRMGK